MRMITDFLTQTEGIHVKDTLFQQYIHRAQSWMFYVKSSQVALFYILMTSSDRQDHAIYSRWIIFGGYIKTLL